MTKHFAREDWIDFVNAAATPARQQEMQRHLDSGCPRCNKIVNLWRKVRRVGAEERHYQPPAETVRVVEAAFGGAPAKPKPGFGAVVAELLFDSFAQPAVAGARSAVASSRQMLFSAHQFQIDVNIECKPGDSHLFVTGQLLDHTQPDSFARGVVITISNRRGQTVQLSTNAHGEFCGELEDRGDLELSFPGPGEKPIVVSLADALGRLNTRSRAFFYRPERA